MVNEPRLHQATEVPDPPTTEWTRKNFPESVMKPSDVRPREKAELETDRDLAKSIEQLLCDFQEQAIKKPKSDDPQASILEITLHAQKRMVSMMAKVALSNERMALAMFALAAAAVLCSIIALLK